MNSWHVTPEYINTNWTEEQFLLLFRMRNKRIEHENGSQESSEPGKKSASNMSDDAFFAACKVTRTIM